MGTGTVNVPFSMLNRCVVLVVTLRSPDVPVGVARTLLSVRRSTAPKGNLNLVVVNNGTAGYPRTGLTMSMMYDTQAWSASWYGVQTAPVLDSPQVWVMQYSDPNAISGQNTLLKQVPGNNRWDSVESITLTGRKVPTLTPDAELTLARGTSSRSPYPADIAKARVTLQTTAWSTGTV
jgi:hypothetical protein